MKINGLGAAIYIAQKVDAVISAYEFYEATQSNDALIDVTTKVAELTAGAAVGFLVDRTVGAFSHRDWIEYLTAWDQVSQTRIFLLSETFFIIRG